MDDFPRLRGGDRSGRRGARGRRSYLVQRDAQELAERVQTGGARGAVGRAGRRWLWCHPASSGGGCPGPSPCHPAGRPPPGPGCCAKRRPLPGSWGTVREAGDAHRRKRSGRKLGAGAAATGLGGRPSAPRFPLHSSLRPLAPRPGTPGGGGREAPRGLGAGPRPALRGPGGQRRAGAAPPGGWCARPRGRATPLPSQEPAALSPRPRNCRTRCGRLPPGSSPGPTLSGFRRGRRALLGSPRPSRVPAPPGASCAFLSSRARPRIPGTCLAGSGRCSDPRSPQARATHAHTEDRSLLMAASL